MNIFSSIAKVTGADRGLGRAFARELVSRGADKVHGASRNPASVTEPDVTPIALDVTDSDRIVEIEQKCQDVNVLANSTGLIEASSFIDAPCSDAARLEMDTNCFGPLSMRRAFAPAVAANGGGAIVDMLSGTSFYTNPLDAFYGDSKAAEWPLTNGVRIELAHQGTLAVVVQASFIDTDMAAETNEPKISPQSVVQQAFDAVEAGKIEVLADERSRFVKKSLSRDHELIYPQVQEFWDSAPKAGH
jgi:NAD(P)-dependent dehydrogenase (short-subunit alcohol dehydrogenase family)